MGQFTLSSLHVPWMYGRVQRWVSDEWGSLRCRVCTSHGCMGRSLHSRTNNHHSSGRDCHLHVPIMFPSSGRLARVLVVDLLSDRPLSSTLWLVSSISMSSPFLLKLDQQKELMVSQTLSGTVPVLYTRHWPENVFRFCSALLCPFLSLFCEENDGF